MINNSAPKKTYHIAFDTTSTPGYMRAVKVTIECDMLPDDHLLPPAEQTQYDVSLAEHPLYNHLQRYVNSNKR